MPGQAPRSGVSSHRHDVTACPQDARLGFEGLDLGGLEASPFVAVQNVLDAWYNSSVIVNAFGKRFYEPGPGRTFLLGLGISWGH